MTSRTVINDSHSVPRPAFTLVEVLVVLVLISILSGMVMTAVRGVNLTARQARTRSIIAIVDSVIQEQYESYKYRPLPVEIPDLLSPTPPNSGVLKYEVLPNEAARVRLNMIRDLQRMELPDRITDITVDPSATTAGAIFAAVNQPASIVALADRVLITPTGYLRSPDRSLRRLFPVNWFSTASPPNRFAAYRRLIRPTWTAEFQSAECLYMIMSTTFVGGAPALEQIPPSNIGDTDGDGMPEILDGWGRPLGFVRWPVGFDDPELSVDRSMPDDFDPLRADFASIPGVITDITSPGGVPRPWSIRPLIISAGSDGEFGLELHASNAGFRYNTASPGALDLMAWPVTAAMMGDELPGRSAPTIFVDPFLRHFPGVVPPGSPITGAEGVRADNISNYQLAVSE
jgi:prepilin-type N-terminal cleavage/methylation domain-containing protein